MNTTVHEDDLAARHARVQENIALIRSRLDEIVTREVRALGWSAGDAQVIARHATLEYFGALARHLTPQQALPHAIEEADRKHVVAYLNMVAKAGKLSMRHALQDVLERRLDARDTQQRQALQAALHEFDRSILQRHSVDEAVSASRAAAEAIMQAAA